MNEHNRIITTANQKNDVAQIIYGLSLRGVQAKFILNPDKQADRYQIIHESPAPDAIHIRIAQDSIAGIWDAILDEYERAVTLSGHCYFCRYDVTGLPRPTTCPECGTNLDSQDARRAMRDKNSPKKI